MMEVNRRNRTPGAQGSELCYNCGGSGDGGFAIRLHRGGKAAAWSDCPRCKGSGYEPEGVVS